MVGIKNRMDIILIFIGHFWVYVGSVILLINSLDNLEGIASIYYLISIAIFIAIITIGVEKHSGKKCWKIILFFDFILFFIFFPIVILIGLSGLAWA